MFQIKRYNFEAIQFVPAIIHLAIVSLLVPSLFTRIIPLSSEFILMIYPKKNSQGCFAYADLRLKQ